jgi:hypothetical protein
MPDIKVNLSDSAKAQEKFGSAEPKGEEFKRTELAPNPPEGKEKEESKPFRSRRPSDWTARSIGEGKIRAECINGEVFEGKIAEFNRRLRGG